MQPSISIVVTCYNYGHFLDACLDSLAAQTLRPDEIIVVDDGSRDATSSVLRARSEPLTVLEKENGGQASAFNAGFARATGDIVLFLDADDTLAPDALENIRTAWHDSFAAISFKLNLIDAAGRFCGFYEVEPREGDMRPELLGRGHFRFLPTSGNAFNRRLIASAFPLPEPRWRISADTVLLRIAALAGPLKQLPLALGNYRAHGGNSYHRVALPLPQFWGRAMRDAADACLETADLPSDSTIFGSDPDIVWLDLVLASLRLTLGLRDFGERGPQASRIVRESMKRLLRFRVGLRAKILYGFCLLLLPLSLRLIPKSRLWVAEPDLRPRVLSWALSRALGADLKRRRRSSHRSRWLGSAKAGYFSPWAGHDGAALFNTFDWQLRRSDSGRVLCNRTGEIVVPVDYFPNGARLSLDLKAIGPYAHIPVEAELAMGDQLLGQTRISGAGRLSVVLEPNVTLLGFPLQLEFSALPRPATVAHRWAVLTGPAGVLQVTGLQVEALSGARSGFMLGLGETHDFAEIASACLVSPLPDSDPGWPALVEADQMVLSFIRPTVSEPTELVLHFQEDQMDGSLVVADGNGPLYRGRIGASAVVRIPIDPRRYPDDREFIPTLSLDPEDPFAAAAFRLSSIGLAGAGSSLKAWSSKDFPLIGLGAIWRFEDVGRIPGFLGDGWTESESGAELFDTLGVLRFTIDPTASGDAVLHMRMAPAIALPNDALLTVAISIRNEVVSQVFLQGEHDLAVPLGEVLTTGRRQIELGVHVALSVGGVSDTELRRGGLLLKSVRLSSRVRQFPTPRSSPHVGHTLSSVIGAAGARASKMLTKKESFDPSEISELLIQHRHIVAAIRTLAHGAVLSVLLNDETLKCLLDLSQVVYEVGEGPSTRGSQEDYAGFFTSDAVDAVRATALAIMTGPPWRVLAGRTLDDLSEVLRAFPSHLARYLCSVGHTIESPDDQAACRRHIVALLDYARARFAMEPRGSRHERLAEEILRQVRLHPLLFGPGSLQDVGGTLGAAIESYLLSRGRHITLPRSHVGSSGRLRLGVLVRHLGAAPETWILAGTIGALPPDRFELIIFALGQGTEAPMFLPGSATVIDLDGVGVDRAVEIVRAAQLDIFLLGAFFQSYDYVAAVAAHRLAPVQVATTAVSPMTTGLKSFDVMLSSSICEPPGAAVQYTERLHLSATPVQRFEFGASAPRAAENRTLERERLGISADAVVLVSGAMLLKIRRELIETWTDILAAAPATVLLLYPFASSWLTTFHSRSRFERHLQMMCKSKGVDWERVRILDNVDHSEVGRVLSISDLYLDSFPYAGATTVVEALTVNLPAVAYEGDSQRGLQGAAWLKAYGLGHLVASTPTDYARIAAELANDRKARATAAASIKRSAPLEAQTFGNHFAALLSELSGLPLPMADSPPLLFHHLPKGAGKTCRKVFGEWFSVLDDDRAPWSSEPAPPPLDVSGMGSQHLICGHFDSPGYLLRERYPALLKNPSSRLITFLRDPVETALSSYFYQRKHRPNFDPEFETLPLDEYLATCPGHLAKHLQCIDDDWRVAMEHYWFIGITERLEECIGWLAMALGKPVPEKIGRLNETFRSEQPSDAAISEFTRRNAIDFEIYRSAVARCARTLQMDPHGFRSADRRTIGFNAPLRRQGHRSSRQ